MQIYRWSLFFRVRVYFYLINTDHIATKSPNRIVIIANTLCRQWNISRRVNWHCVLSSSTFDVDFIPRVYVMKLVTHKEEINIMHCHFQLVFFYKTKETISVIVENTLLTTFLGKTNSISTYRFSNNYQIETAWFSFISFVLII